MLDRIEILGYRRLAETSVYVGRKAVALVGPNEAGKTSVLSALRLFDDDEPVPSATYSRSLRSKPRESNSDVVRTWFALSKLQQDAVGAMPLATRPRHYRRHKKVDGSRPFSFSPTPVLDPRLRTELADSWAVLEGLTLKDLPIEAADYTPDEEQLRSDFTAAELSLSAPDAAGDDVWQRIKTTLDNVPSKTLRRKEHSALRAFSQYFEWARPGVSIQVVIRDKLGVSSPPVAMFGTADRELRSQYSLDDPSTDDSRALANLLAIAEISLDEIRANRADAAYVKELLEKATARLGRFFASRWSQEPVGVGLDLDGQLLQVFVRDTGDDSVGWLSINERSDGLRMFVALATFLARSNEESPPILLIDEAEQHLHLNAQADLVQMLASLPQIQQVIYTTHSPGCLPSDIGNGVRFVEPLSDGSSRIRHDFWSMQSHSHVGFNPLLMVMGAGAAAFSGLRFALFVEGASDMLILPTLIRLATDENELPYQVAPGISVANQSDLHRMDFTAGRVTFLVDGDSQGKKWRDELVAAEVPAHRIRTFPNGIAIEDLLDREYYLSVVADFMGLEIGQFSDLSDEGPIKLALERWAHAHRKRVPGAIAVTEHMLGLHESGTTKIKIDPSKKRTLKDLDKWARKQLELD